ncbi:hypothetical protein KCG44_14095 [Pacificimonas sp. WHA3]|uniref:Endonuclease/exonuclease/phosphatase domain-containing protein n=1 Tax=Pacificimonas pallii TaxID=2827236 RepID=A0ABS6SIM6_9SPHN|nr:endonuclease/exonuclease/phosphatase family protein [Pacificimonas pallii]MBV7257913.1 hypothetical protein [Pacificimonas pallii]
MRIISKLMLSTAIVTMPVSTSAIVFVNEFHYDNRNADVGEFIELAGSAGDSLDGWSLALYNGTASRRSVYNTINLGGTFGDVSGGFGFLSFDAVGLQNGGPDGFALVDNGGSVVEFLSYEGSFTAASGPAGGMTSVDVGVRESSSTPVGFSLQRTGSGSAPGDFTWAAPQTATRNMVNAGQSFTGAPPPPPPPPSGDLTAIYDIQGAAQTSPLEGRTVTTSGIVTSIARNGFYVQDAAGDGNVATSDAIFVFTGGAPTVTAGDDVTISGRVSEFIPGGARTGNLSQTQIARPDSLTVNSSGNALPAAVVLGASGRMAPTQIIDDDNFAAFDPENDGIDFYESMEGMIVTVENAAAVGPTNRFGETFVVANGGAGATGVNARGGLTISEGDFNPERIQLQGGQATAASVGDQIGDVEGVLGYNFGNYEIVPLDGQSVDVVQAGNLVPETTTIDAGGDRLTVASFNVLNLDANDADGDSDIADGKFAALGAQIANNMGAPDIIALQEIQDSSGSFNDGTTDATLTLQTLVEAIAAAGGPRYAFAEVAPQDGTAGGQPGGNIRNAYLYLADRVDLVEDSVAFPDGATTDPAFAGSRKPLVAEFVFNGETVTLINNHFSSKLGSSPLFGAVQPPINSGEDERRAQAAFVNALVDTLLADNPLAKVITLGDLNEFSFFSPLEILRGIGGEQVLTDLADLLAGQLDAYSFIFDGNSQLLDHILVTQALLGLDPQFDIVHANSEFFGAPSDHDALIASFLIEAAAVSAPGILGLLGLSVAALAWRRRRMVV